MAEEFSKNGMMDLLDVRLDGDSPTPGDNPILRVVLSRRQEQGTFRSVTGGSTRVEWGLLAAGCRGAAVNPDAGVRLWIDEDGALMFLYRMEIAEYVHELAARQSAPGAILSRLGEDIQARRWGPPDQ
jgi:hypothetical protein